LSEEYVCVPTCPRDRPWNPWFDKDIPMGFKKIKKSDLPKYFKELNKNV
jgi:hypothetical protein